MDKTFTYTISKPHNNSPTHFPKSAVIWGNADCLSFPLLHLRKPKWMTFEQYTMVVDHLSLRFSGKIVSLIMEGENIIKSKSIK